MPVANCKFGEWLIKKMIGFGHTESSLSYAINISRSQINRHIQGKAKPNIASLRSYCRLFNCMHEFWDVMALVYEV